MSLHLVFLCGHVSVYLYTGVCQWWSAGVFFLLLHTFSPLILLRQLPAVTHPAIQVFSSKQNIRIDICEILYSGKIVCKRVLVPDPFFFLVALFIFDVRI